MSGTSDLSSRKHAVLIGQFDPEVIIPVNVRHMEIKKFATDIHLGSFHGVKM
jgi:hypothetical protein